MRVIVVGGGIAGLTAALRLAESGARVTVIEATDRLGGKLHTHQGLELGAENFLVRGPSAAVRLATELGLEIVNPTGVPAALWLDGSLQPLPAGAFMGIPAQGTETDTGEPVLTGDIAVGALVRQRRGDAVVEHYVDPLLGGVYAGHADQLSIEATMPALYKQLLTAHTLTEAIASVPSTGTGPVFGTVVGGLSRLVNALELRLQELGVEIRLGEPVRQLPEGPVVLAIPAGKARKLIPTLPVVEYASVGLITLHVENELPDLSGFLVPADQGLTIKAATFFSRKWTHVTGQVVRVSIGRFGEVEALQSPDIVQTAIDDLSTVLGPLSVKRASVQRWGGGLPQYTPGHVTRVATARTTLHRVALAGAAWDGIGIPACIASAEAATHTLIMNLGGRFDGESRA